MYRSFVKPAFDFLFALIGLLVLSPLIILFTLVLYVANNGQPFFLHERPGKNGEVFSVIKFRTMNNKKDAQGNLLPGDQRITRVGNFMRKYSLDEILQLVNVLSGKMSFVGPRPLEVFYLPLYSERQARRHELKPGITGWAQVHGRNTLTWEERFEYDVWYVDHMGFLLDLKILWKTGIKVMKMEGTQHIPPFQGSAESK